MAEGSRRYVLANAQQVPYPWKAAHDTPGWGVVTIRGRLGSTRGVPALTVVSVRADVRFSGARSGDTVTTLGRSWRLITPSALSAEGVENKLGQLVVNHGDVFKNMPARAGWTKQEGLTLRPDRIEDLGGVQVDYEVRPPTRWVGAKTHLQELLGE